MVTRWSFIKNDKAKFYNIISSGIFLTNTKTNTNSKKSSDFLKTN